MSNKSDKTHLMQDLEEMVAAIGRLPPAQRRALQLRLHTSGLFVVEDLLTDKHKLSRATAAPNATRAASQPAQQAQMAFDARSADPLQTDQPPTAAAKAQPRSLSIPLPPASPTAGGKAVMGAPQHSEADIDPQAMPPLPGQAPSQPIAIIFDGGSRGNPGEGYGSYQLRWPGAPPQVVRLRFGNNITNNEAEYDTLIGALESVLKRLVDSGAAPKTAQLDIHGDSLLVINQVMGEWKCKDARMEKRRDRVRALLKQFGAWSLAHHDRENSVRALGH